MSRTSPTTRTCKRPRQGSRLRIGLSLSVVLGLGAGMSAFGGRAGADSFCTSPNSLAACILNATNPLGGTQGVLLQQQGGPVLASSNASVLYEPASSIKPVIALYAIELVEQGLLRLTDEIPKIDTSGGPDACPPSNVTGTEPVGAAIQQMLQVSDNNRTRELMQVLGVDNLNAFAASLGLPDTMFQTSGSTPGFNVIGCLSYPNTPLPATIDGNTMSLTDVTALWKAIAALPAPYADTFYGLAAGRDMFNSRGFDFANGWPGMVSLATSLGPTYGVTGRVLQSFIDHMSVSFKIGSYNWVTCDPTCQEGFWRIFAGVAQIPGCSGSTYAPSTYESAVFIDRAVGDPASVTSVDSAFASDSLNLLAEPVASGLATWTRCAPVARARLHATGARSMSSTGTIGVDTALTTVTDGDVADIPQDLTGTIAWGDGASSVATISGRLGQFVVHGWHSYASAGRYRIKVTVRDVGSGKTVKHKIKLTVS